MAQNVFLPHLLYYQTKPDIILNLQGDAVLTPPWVIQSLMDAMMQ